MIIRNEDFRKTRMFGNITRTWNPVTGCKHDCVYCWARRYALKLKKQGIHKYENGFEPSFHEKELNRRFKAGEFIFVVSMGDLFGSWVKCEWILKVLAVIRKNPQTKFMLLTKNPARYQEFDVPSNAICGATIESDIDALVSQFSRAPPPSERINAMKMLTHEKFISIEPVMAFSENFARKIIEINPQFVYIGRDNWYKQLPEPTTKKIMEFAEELSKAGITVILKTI